MKTYKQLVVLSGKGGTGKTSITAAFAHLSSHAKGNCNNLFVDADVDAANLSLLLTPKIERSNEYWGGSLAFIDANKCLGCGDCVLVCRYNAILPDSKNNSIYWIDPIACDGCAACVYACPQQVISMVQQQEGLWFESETRFGKLFHAELFPGRENSGKLVTLIRQRAKLAAVKSNSNLIIIDGPPGIGCPVISACAGVDLGLLVAEPSLSGLHDLKRVHGVLKHFNIQSLICINKADIYEEGTRLIREYADSEGINVIGEISFDEHLPQAMVKALPVTAEYPDCESSKAILKMWVRVFDLLTQ